MYRADLDTTFALYDKAFFNSNRFMEAVRVAGHFTCRHLPWYREKELPEEEECFYRATQRFSYYLCTGAREHSPGNDDRDLTGGFCDGPGCLDSFRGGTS